MYRDVWNTCCLQSSLPLLALPLKYNCPRALATTAVPFTSSLQGSVRWGPYLHVLRRLQGLTIGLNANLVTLKRELALQRRGAVVSLPKRLSHPSRTHMTCGSELSQLALHTPSTGSNRRQ
jgi:hypothetical protein